jgi:hypothetical protein
MKVGCEAIGKCCLRINEWIVLLRLVYEMIPGDKDRRVLDI